MRKQNVHSHQQDMFSHDSDKIHWDDFAPDEQEQLMNLLAGFFQRLSYDSVNHGGFTCKTK